jgi:Xaa-Pro aminopeptidase
MESGSLPVDTLESISKHIPDVEWVGCPGLIESQLRSIKDEPEITAIRQAVAFAEEGFRQLLAMLTPEMTEFEASYELEHAMRKLGARGHAFPAIVARDDRAALPHYSPSLQPIGRGNLLLIDWGAETHSRYRCDLTRTLILGEADARLQTVYQTVLEAQRLAIDAIAPGRSCREIDAIARNYIADNGFGDYFGHGLGHGFGLRIHEQPRFSPMSEDTLETGMVVTVEPGIYLPGWGGVRIEDDVLVTSEGHEVLSSLPKSFETARLGLVPRD